MASSRIEDSPTCGALIVHAVLPPPVTGMTLCTEAMADWMAQSLPVERYSFSDGSSKITTRFRIHKLFRALSSPFRLLFGRRIERAVFYMPCNAGWAVAYNVCSILAAKLKGYRCIVHHHIYQYLTKHQWRIQVLTWLLGPNDLQIVLCRDMERRLRELYGSHLAVAIVPSTIQLLSKPQPPRADRKTSATAPAPFRIGHISNLQLSKGLDLVIEVFRKLRADGANVELVLAGPIYSHIEQQLVDEAQAEFGSLLDYQGPVYADAKQAFFDSLDAMLYPTRYDAQPLVVSESLAVGCPIISYGQGCIPGLMPQNVPWTVEPGADFVEPAVRILRDWIDNDAVHATARVTARKRFDELLQEARRALAGTEQWIRGTPAPDFVLTGRPPNQPEAAAVRQS